MVALEWMRVTPSPWSFSDTSFIFPKKSERWRQDHSWSFKVASAFFRNSRTESNSSHRLAKQFPLES